MVYLGQEEGAEEIARLLEAGSLVPIIGAGFSQGSRCHGNNEVPNGQRATALMKEIILSLADQVSVTDLQGLSFGETSTVFNKIAGSEDRKRFLRDYFTEARLSPVGRRFLEYNWPYAYTLNVDDAIERTGLFAPVLPYRRLDTTSSSRELRLLYKLHGDAQEEVKYCNDSSPLVFSPDQYVDSITKDDNQDILNNLIGDYATRNLLFIGCSLIDEPDLKFVYSKAGKTASVSRILVTNEKPSTLREIQLGSYGINTIIIAEDYNTLYEQINQSVKRRIAEVSVLGYRYRNPSVRNATGSKETKALLSGGESFDLERNEIIRGGMEVERRMLSDLIRTLEKRNCVLVKGRRFSGKSLLLNSLMARLRNKEIYYFPSTTSTDMLVVSKLLNESSDSLFVFDSNSIGQETYQLLANSKSLLKARHNHLVIAINSSDDWIVRWLDAEMLVISGTLRRQECIDLNRPADFYGLQRRQFAWSNLDYIEALVEKKQLENPTTLAQFDKLTFHEQVMSVLLAAEDKLFVSDALSLDIGVDEIGSFVKRYPLIVEEVPVEDTERDKHSGTKLVHNSKLVLYRFVEGLSEDDICRCITHVVRRVKNDRDRKRVYVDLIMFDTLNQLFSKKHTSARLIYRVYDELSSLLSSDMHYWLQRAKSIYWLNPDDGDKLKMAYGYASKAHDDGTYNVKKMAALSLALVCCLLANLSSGEERLSYLEEAVVDGLEAIESDYYRYRSYLLNNKIDTGKRKNAFTLLKDCAGAYLGEYPNGDCIEKAADLERELRNLKEAFQHSRVR